MSGHILTPVQISLVKIKVWKWTCESECVKVNVWKWICESECVKVKVWTWRYDSESVKVKVLKCKTQSESVYMWMWKCESESKSEPVRAHIAPRPNVTCPHASQNLKKIWYWNACSYSESSVLMVIAITILAKVIARNTCVSSLWFPKLTR